MNDGVRTVYQRIYVNESCPLSDYPGHTLRVLANPTPHEKNEWAFSGLGTPNCAECARLKGQEIAYCAVCSASRARFGKIAVVILEGSAFPGFDVSTPEAALSSFDAAQTEMPDELLLWVYMAPAVVWDRRADELKKKLTPVSRNGS